MEKLIKLENGLFVKLEVFKNSVSLTYKDNWVSFCPSIKQSGVSTLDIPSVMLNHDFYGEVVSEGGANYNKV